MRAILTTLLLMPLSVLASEENAVPNNSMDIQLEKLEYKFPKRGKGIAGDFRFKRFNMFRDGMVISMSNRDQVFDSKLFIRSNFIGMKGQYTNIGFTLPEGASFDVIETALLENSTLSINDKFLQFNGNLLNIKEGETDASFTNFNMFCNNESEEGNLDVSLLMGSCYKNGVITKLDPSKHGHVKLAMKEEWGTLDLSAQMKKLKFLEKRILLETDHTAINYNNEFQVRISRINGTCLKSDSGDDESAIMNSTINCLGDINFGETNLLVIDKQEGTRFKLQVESLKVKDNRIKALGRQVNIKSSESHTVVEGLDLDCYKEDPLKYDIGTILADCSAGADIYMRKLNSLEKDEATFSSTRGKYVLESTAKDVSMTIRNGGFRLKAKVKGGLWLSLKATGDAYVNKEEKAIRLKLRNVDFALGKWGLLKAIKWFVVDGEMIKLEGDNLYIYL